MDDRSLEEIFSDDPFDLLKGLDKPKQSKPANTLVAGFEEINTFFEMMGRLPEASDDFMEQQLFDRLKFIQEDAIKMEELVPYDHHHILKPKFKEYSSMDDILNDSMDILGLNDEKSLSMFKFNHAPQKTQEKESPNYVAKRKPCKNFKQYEQLFKDVHSDLENGDRRLIRINRNTIKPDSFYLLNGMVVYLESINYEGDYKKQQRVSKEGRTKCIFDNGTESDMLASSFHKALSESKGKAITRPVSKNEEEFKESFSSKQKNKCGFIYVLRTLKDDLQLKSVRNLHKIGYCTTNVEKRLRNAENDPTYLMGEVEAIAIFETENLNVQAFEQNIHRFFGKVRLDISITDNNGKNHKPKEWFDVPLNCIRDAVELIVKGKSENYRYNSVKKKILPKRDRI